MEPRLQSYIATRDRRMAKDQPWDPAPLSDYFNQLVTKGSVIVGGRASCGGRVDPTWTAFTLWGEVVRKARTFGYVIDEVSIKHGNGWATKAGGFWNEREYSLVTRPQTNDQNT